MSNDEQHVEVRKVAHWLPANGEQLDDAATFWDEVRRAQREYAALSSNERERLRVEREIAYEAERCTSCGCHRDEHGGY